MTNVNKQLNIIAKHYKMAAGLGGVGEAATKEVAKDIGKAVTDSAVNTAEQVAKDIARQTAKGVGQSLKETGNLALKNVGKAYWAEGLPSAVKQIIVEIVSSFTNAVKTTVKNKSLFKVLFVNNLDNMESSTKDVLKTAVGNNLKKLFIFGKDAGSQFVKNKLEKDPIALLRALSNPESFKTFVIEAEKAGVKDITKIMNPKEVGSVITKIESDITTLMAKDAQFAAKIAPYLGTYGLAAKVITYSQLVSFISEKIDNYKQNRMTLNEKLNNLVSELNDMITPGILPILSDPAFASQSPQFIGEVRKEIVQLKRIMPKLTSLESQFINSIANSSENEKQKVQSFLQNNASLEQTVASLSVLLQQIENNLDNYHRSWTELSTALSVGTQSASIAEKIRVHANTIKIDVDVFVKSIKETQTSVATKDKELIISQVDNKTAQIIRSYMKVLKAVANTSNCKKKILKFADTYDNIQNRKITQKDPGWISKTLAPFIAKNFPSLVKNPEKLQAAIILFDAAFMKMNVSMGQSLGSGVFAKVLAPIAAKAFGAAAGQAVGATAGAVGGVMLGGISAVDLANSVVMWATKNDNIKDDVSNIVSALTQLEGTEQNEFKQVCDRVIGKISGTGYAIVKATDEIKSAKLPQNENLTVEDINTITNLMHKISFVVQNYKDLSEGLDVLKKKETRDLYIKHSESILGMAGRGVDKTVSTVTTMFGLLGDKKNGDNETGGLNPYNHLMQMIESLEMKLGQIFQNIEPMIKAVSVFKQKIDQLNEQVKLVAEQQQTQTSEKEEQDSPELLTNYL